MAWRFNVSKFKNATPKIPKKDQWISDVNSNNLLNCCGNHIKCSTQYIAYNTSNGGVLGVCPLNHVGKVEKMDISAHSEFITDFDFSPFDGSMIATCSSDCTAKIWKFPNDTTECIDNPQIVICSLTKRIERIIWHPSASDIISLTCFQTAYIYDVHSEKCVYEFSDHDDQIQSICWKGDGTQFVTSCKDKILRILDPRKKLLCQKTDGPIGIRDSRAQWLGISDFIITTGFNDSRFREVKVYDTRNFKSPISTREIGTNNGILIPLFDEDTNMLFLAGKGDTMISYLEFLEKSPYLTDPTIDKVEQFKGACLVPKQALNVMTGEVNRLLLLTLNAIIPMPYIVPRKSYYDFHADLFPDTKCSQPSMTSSTWLNGGNIPLCKISLNPTNSNELLRQISSGITEESCDDVKLRKSNTEEECSTSNMPFNVKLRHSKIEETINDNSEKESCSFPKIKLKNVKKPDDLETNNENISTKLNIDENQEPVQIRKNVVNKFRDQRISKYKHLHGKPLHKNFHLYNLKNLRKTIPGESDGFSSNSKRCAVPLEGPGGRIAILEIQNGGKLPLEIPSLHNGSRFTDFQFDPFDELRIAVSCEDSSINIWNIPEDGLIETLSTPNIILRGHLDKIYFIKFHPLAKDILASGSFDLTIKIWNIIEELCVYSLSGHTDVIFSFSWHPEGILCATLCKDTNIRIYDPRKSLEPIQVASCIPDNCRAGRIQFVCNGEKLAVSGFTKTQNRAIWIFDAINLSSNFHTCEEIDVSPATLMMLYDEDTNTIFTTGKGDGTIFSFEVSRDSPFLFRLSDFKGDGSHQGISLLPKIVCNVKSAEFARILRLTRTTVEPIPFTVPRRKMNYFQDDIFPPTKITWESSMTAKEWLSGCNNSLKTLDLQPPDMEKLSDNPDKPRETKYKFAEEVKTKTENEKREELLKSFGCKIDKNKDKELEQDNMEGVDDEEWEES